MENDSKSRLAPPEPKIDETDGFAKSDIFGYAEFGGRLANIVQNLPTPLVLALTGGWGSGKSVFAKQWAGELRKRWAKDGDNRKPEDAPVIYFDAFANDYQDNAFLALAGEVLAALKKCGAETEGLKNKAADVGKTLLSTSANVAVHWATGGATDAGKIAAGVKGALAERLENVVENRVALDDFRIALGKTAEKIGGGQPLVFIVDELDRCRPDFALELLEKIKHLFSVPNVCFLVVTNLEQFGAVVQRAYGYNADEARVYLEKFFHHSFRIPFCSLSSQSPSRYIRRLWESMNFPPVEYSTPLMMQEIKRISAYYGFSLRELEQVFACAAVYLAGKDGKDFPDHSAGAYMTAALFVLRKTHPQVYSRILSQATVGSDNPPQDINWEDLPGELKNEENPLSLLMAVIKENMTERESRFYIAMPAFHSGNSVRDRKQSLAQMAQERIEMWSRL